MRSVRLSVLVGCASVLIATAGCGLPPADDGALAGDEHVASSQHALNYGWSAAFGNTNWDYARGVGVDSSGNMIFAGTLGGTVDLGAGPVSGGSTDIFVAKVTSAGGYVWSQRISSTGSGGIQDIAVDSSDNVLIAGTFSNSINFGGPTLTSAGWTDVFLAKFDSSGNHVWSQSFGNGNYDNVSSVATDSSGNVIITGYFSDTVSFGGTPLVSAGSTDIFVAKFDSSGNHVWSQSFGSASAENGNGVAADSAGNVLVTGEKQGTVDFGDGPLASNGYSDIFLVKLSSAGAHLWSKSIGDTYDDFAQDVAVDGEDNVIITGGFSGTVDFGGGPHSSNNLIDGFVTKYDDAGNYLWANSFTSYGMSAGYRVTTDADGNVFTAGAFAGVLWFPDYPDTENVGGWFVMQLNDAGDTLTWLKAFDATQIHMDTDAAGSLFVGGGFEWGTNLGGGYLSNAGSSDIYIGKFTP
ncbi:hypothetical protein WMF20_11085 [Sorangium sp. So ce834]|uniref:hypothetical protein n=1 Tax=Sorangium sp. So ce834 TaxID=3133321 RepID=UPI003F634EA7